MDQNSLQAALQNLNLPEIHFFDEIDSTNARALELASRGADEFTLVIAERQTSGRGRLGRHWETASGTSLAFSVIINPRPEEIERMGLFSLLGALSVCAPIEKMAKIQPKVKWPNDVLLDGRKVAGILTEANWVGTHTPGIVLGIGVNLLKGSAPISGKLLFPATDVAEYCSEPISRLNFLETVLIQLIKWRPNILEDEFLDAYRRRLAFLGQRVVLSANAESQIEGKIIGVDDFGHILLKSEKGIINEYPIGDLKLRPIV